MQGNRWSSKGCQNEQDSSRQQAGRRNPSRRWVDGERRGRNPRFRRTDQLRKSTSTCARTYSSKNPHLPTEQRQTRDEEDPPLEEMAKSFGCTPTIGLNQQSDCADPKTI